MRIDENIAVTNITSGFSNIQIFIPDKKELYEMIRTHFEMPLIWVRIEVSPVNP
jgi:hypothetical protein